jgi:hypothetical protein
MGRYDFNFYRGLQPLRGVHIRLPGSGEDMISIFTRVCRPKRGSADLDRPARLGVQTRAKGLTRV